MSDMPDRIWAGSSQAFGNEMGQWSKEHDPDNTEYRKVKKAKIRLARIGSYGLCECGQYIFPKKKNFCPNCGGEIEVRS